MRKIWRENFHPNYLLGSLLLIPIPTYNFSYYITTMTRFTHSNTLRLPAPNKTWNTRAAPSTFSPFISFVNWLHHHYLPPWRGLLWYFSDFNMYLWKKYICDVWLLNYNPNFKMIFKFAAGLNLPFLYI